MPQIETSATRVLANAMLYEVDRVCEDASVSNYARFMDDMDVGVGSIVQAKQIIRDIDLTLQSRQLRLNSSKTKILTQKDAFEYFCISENDYLARADRMLETFSKFPKALKLIRRSLLSKYEKWLQRTPSNGPGAGSIFLRSNGSKIHKYVLRLIYQSGGSVSNDDLLWIIRNDPGMRSTAFIYLARSRQPNNALERVHSIFRSGVFVDDASLVNMTGFLLHTRFRRTQKSIRLSRDIVRDLEGLGQLGTWCAIHVATRFCFPAEILSFLRRNIDRIGTDYWISRAVGGVFARFVGNTTACDRYIRIIRDVDSAPSFEVYEYLLAVATATTLPNSMLSYLKAPNPTFPQEIYYPKVLALLAMSQNANLSATYASVKALHPSALSDPFYKKMGLV